MFEDWDFVVRAAMAVGVVSIPTRRRCTDGSTRANADTAESVATWEQAHAMVIDRLSSQPVLLPVGDARRLAATHFVTDGRDATSADLAEADAATRSAHTVTDSLVAGVRELGLSSAVRHRSAARRP